jgi:arabinogalactan endo-1,4-beta-galactosidase
LKHRISLLRSAADASLAALLVAIFCSPTILCADEYAIGADLSFLADAEARGVVFKDGGQPKPGLQIFKDHGYNWIRLRLFYAPTALPNDLDYTVALAKEAKRRFATPARCPTWCKSATK